MRLLLALTVAVVHASAVGFGTQPHVGSATVGDLAVDGFFVLSGFLVTRSWVGLASPLRFVWHRFLRLMPGFWVCLVVTGFLFAPLIAVASGRSAGSVFVGGESALDYVTANSLLLMRQFGISDLLQDSPADGVMDGSLWTLFYEAICYGLVAALGLVGVLRRRRGGVLALAVLLWVLTVLQEAGLIVVAQERLLRFGLVFLAGALAYLYAERVPVRASLGVTSAVVLGASLLLLDDYRAVAAPAFAYLLIWAMVALPLRQNPRVDLSYGLYCYHWPVQAVLLTAGFAAAGVLVFTLVSLVVATGLAFLSWHLVERPALAQKDARWVSALAGRSRREGSPAALVVAPRQERPDDAGTGRAAGGLTGVS